MNKFLKKLAAFVIGASLIFSASSVQAAFAETADTATAETTEEPGDVSESKPVVVGYSITSKNGRAVTRLTPDTKFNIRIMIKDLGLKTSDIGGAADIDFVKTVDNFRGTMGTTEITSSSDGLLMFAVEMKECIWTGGSVSFGFMLGYLSKGSNYATMSVDITECSEGGSSNDDDVTFPEPFFMIKANEPEELIKAGDEGTLDLTVKNLGSTDADRILMEFSPSEDILITGGTGTQDIKFLSSGDQTTLKIKYKALNKINTEKQTFSVSFKYYYENGTSEMTGSSTASFSVACEVSTVEKVYPVVLSEFDLTEKELAANSEYSGYVTIKNIGSADMKGVFVTFTSGASFIMTGGTSSCYIEAIEMGGAKRIPVKIKTLSSFDGIRQDLAMSLKYTYLMGSDELDGSTETTFTMFGKIEADPGVPLPVITFSELDEPVAAAKKYRYYVYIENKGEIDMENVSVTLKGSEGLNIIDATDFAFVEKISAGKKKSLKIMFETAAEITANQSISAELSYSYLENGKRQQGSQSAMVSVDAQVSGAPVVRLYGESLAEAIVADTEYEYTMTLKNFGDITVRDIYLNFAASDSLYFLDGTEYAHIDIIRPGKSADVAVKFKTTKQIAGAKQLISANITYNYGVVNAEKQGTAEGSVTLIAAGGDMGGNSSAPNVIIGNYDIGADQIAAGDSFDLNLDFYNTSSATSVENLVMTVNASGDLNIFGGANTYFYPTLAATGAVNETVSLRALPTAATGTSSVSIVFKYDYMNGENRETITSEQTIFIPIYQPDKMSFDVAVPTYSVMAGQEVYVTTTYLNKGRSDISNVKAEIVGDVSALSTSKVIGNVVPGGNGSFDFIITPFMGGECAFTIKITYEDAMLNEVVKEVPVSFMVEEMMWDEPMFPMTMESMEGEGGGGFPWIILWIGIGVVVVGGVITIICVVRHKKKKKKKLTEEDIDWEDDLDDVLSDKDEKTKV